MLHYSENLVISQLERHLGKNYKKGKIGIAFSLSGEPMFVVEKSNNFVPINGSERFIQEHGGVEESLEILRRRFPVEEKTDVILEKGFNF